MKFYWVDAFTKNHMGGNPCAVVLDADHLSSEQMLKLAKEMNLSETAFVLASDAADFKARYFTPAEEIPLAGHPTLSVIRALIESGQIKTEERSKISLELPAGIISVEIDPSDQKITMQQMAPQFLEKHDKKLIADLFSIDSEDILDQVPVQTVSTGTPQLMVPLKSKAALRRVHMNIDKYMAYRKSSDFFSPHFFCLEGFTELGDTSARHLGEPPDTQEDPFTGSATGGMGAFLWHYGLLSSPDFVAEQGHWMERPGMAHVSVKGHPHKIESVRVSGHAVRLIEGHIHL